MLVILSHSSSLDDNGGSIISQGELYNHRKLRDLHYCLESYLVDRVLVAQARRRIWIYTNFRSL